MIPSSPKQSTREQQTSLASRLKFRVVQPVDIPRCHQLESSAYPLKEAASKSTLQYRQHHAAPFFRCVLLQSDEGGGLANGFQQANVPSAAPSSAPSSTPSSAPSRTPTTGSAPRLQSSPADEACHHVHHSPHNHLIGYVCATRCHDYAPLTQPKPSVVSRGEGNGSTASTSSGSSSSSLHAHNDPSSHSPQQPSAHGMSFPYGSYPYPSKHEPNGPLLAIHSIVVQEEYRRKGVARSLLENYIKSIDVWNESADNSPMHSSSAAGGGGHRRSTPHRKKVKKRAIKIEKLVLVTRSHLMELFTSVGFRWRSTVRWGSDPLYELERDVKLTMAPSCPPPQLATMEQDCYIVNAFADPKRCGSGNSAAIVLLSGPPAQILAEQHHYQQQHQQHFYQQHHDHEFNDSNLSTSGMWGMVNEQLDELSLSATGDEEEEEEVAQMRAEVWMHFVAREFNQPATAFVWRIDDQLGAHQAERKGTAKEESKQDLKPNNDNNSGDDDNDQHLGYDIDGDDTPPPPHSVHNDQRLSRDHKVREIHHFIRFYTRSGVEVDMCAHATLASASILLRRYASEKHVAPSNANGGNNINAASTAGTSNVRQPLTPKEIVLAFHSRKDILLRARRAPPSFSFVEPSSAKSSNPNTTPPRTSLAYTSYPPTHPVPPVTNFSSSIPATIRIAMDYPWRTVSPIPPGPRGEVAVIAMLRRAFFGAWSVISPEEDDDDPDTDGLAFSLSVHHVLFMGVTKGGEDLLIELTVEGFDMLCGRNVDYVALKQGWHGYTRGVIVCCEVPDTTNVGGTTADVTHRRGNEGRLPLDFRSRYFEPKVGVNEDPVSGWPHCALGPYFGTRRGKQRVVGKQESDRGGLVECILKEEERRVCIIGSTVTTVAGKLQMQA